MRGIVALLALFAVSAQATVIAPAQRTLTFQPNLGQTSQDIQYSALEPGYAVHLADTGIYFVYGTPARESLLDRMLWKLFARNLHLPRGRSAVAHTIAIEFSGAQQAVNWSGAGPVAGPSHFLRGSDPAGWVRDVPRFSRAHAAAVYPGIDLVFYDKAGQLEYDFIVAPGADARVIRLRARGAGAPKVAADGSVQWLAGKAPLRLHAPTAYQDIDGARRPVAAQYVVRGDQVSLRLGDYDTHEPLVIDPVLEFAALLGGDDNTTAPLGMATDAAGNTYVAGTTCSSAYPATPGSASTQGGASLLANYCEDVFISKLSADGSSLAYSTFIGGSKRDFAGRLALNAAGEVFLTGVTTSTDFPVTAGAYQTTAGSGSCQTSRSLPVPCSDAFVLRLSADGSHLVYATYVGGNFMDGGIGLAVDASGSAHVAGFSNSANFPVTAAAAQRTIGGGSCYAGTMPCFDAVAFKLSPDGTQLQYATFLGGNDGDFGSAMAVDSTGAAYIGGSTYSGNFPTTTGALRTAHTTPAGQEDGFIAKLSASGGQFVYSTLLGGGNSDWLLDLKVDAAGNAYVVGGTGSSDFPTTAGAYQRSYAGPGNVVCSPSLSYAPCGDAFVSRLDASGSALVFSTLLGGSGNDSAAGVVLDASQNVWVTGASASADFPVTPDRFYASNYNTGFLAQLNSTGSQLLYGSGLVSPAIYGMGTAVAVAPNGRIVVSGKAENATRATTPGAFQAGSSGVLVMRFAPGDTGPLLQATPSSLSFPATGAAQAVGSTSAPRNVTLTNTGGGVLLVTPAIVGTGFFQTNNCPASGLAAGASCTVQVYFQPAVAAAPGATLTLASNAPGPVSVALNGVANDPQGGGFIPSGLDFGVQQAGTTSPAAQSAPLVLQATDSFPRVRSVSIGGTNAGDFTVDLGNCAVGAAFCNVAARFSPGAGASGTRTARVSVVTDAFGSPHVLTLSGTVGTGAVLRYQPTVLDFRNAAAGGTSAPLALTLYNTGSASLTVSGLSLSADYSLSTGGSCGSAFPFNIASQASCTLFLALTPASSGNLNTTASFASTSTVAPPVLQLFGAGGPATGPLLSLVSDGRNVDFGANEIGSVLNVPVFFSLLNSGGAAASLSISYTGDYRSDSRYTNCGASLAAGSACTVAVTFAPSAIGTRSGTVTLTSNAPSSPIVLNMTGNGIAVPRLRISPARIDFGAVGVGGTSPAQSVSISNPGTGPLNISAFNIASPFALASNGCTAVLAPGASCTLSVRASPVAPGITTGTLQLGSDAPGQLHTVPLQMRAVNGAALSVLPVALDFGRQAARSPSAARTLSVFNSSNVAVPLSGVSATGDYTQTHDCPSSLAVGSSCTVTVRFVPGSNSDPVSLVGNISIGGAMAGSPLLVPLTGMGSTATGAATTTTLSANPAAAAVGQSVALTANVTSGTAGTIAGTVTFLDGVNTLGSSPLASGTATLVTSLATSGAHVLVAQFGGSATYQSSSSSPLSLVVGGANPDFALTATPSTVTVSAGQTATTTVSLSPLNGSTQSVSLACSGLPAYATCGFSSATTTLNGSSPGTVTMTFRTNVVAALVARAGTVMRAGLQYPGTLLLATMLLGALPARRRRRMLLICASLALAACAGKDSVESPPGDTVTPAGTYTVTITGTSGTISHSATVALTVQ